METKEMVGYGSRNVKLVITEIADAEAKCRIDEFKPDFSFAEHYEKLGLSKQAALAREEARIKAAMAKNEARRELLKKLGFRLLSEEEILAIGEFYADKIKCLKWSKNESSYDIGGIFSGLAAEYKGDTYKCNPWVRLEGMNTELIPLRIAQTLKTLEPLFDNIYIASTGNAENSMRMDVRRVYECPVAVGIAGNDVALLARWGGYPPFLDCAKGEKERTKISLKGFLWGFFLEIDHAINAIRRILSYINQM